MRVKDILFVRDGYQFVGIVLSDIDYIKSDGDTIEIHTGDHKNVIHETLINMESKLDNPFFQVHGSYLVNLKKIERLEGNFILIDQCKILISKQKRAELFRKLNVLKQLVCK